MGLSPGSNTSKRNERLDKAAKRRYETSQTIEFKKQRLMNREKKHQLRHLTEAAEDKSYESNMSIFCSDCKPIADFSDNNDSLVVYFDLETAGFSSKAEILQIGAMHEDIKFSVYITPTRKIPQESTNIHHLVLHEKKLCKVKYESGNDGKENMVFEDLESFPAHVAITKFYNFLYDLGKKSVLVAHNLCFDCPRILSLIKNKNMLGHYQSVVTGFLDTLPIIKQITQKKEKGANKLENVAKDLEISATNAHDALADVDILQQVMIKLGVSNTEIVETCTSWNDKIAKFSVAEKMPEEFAKLQPISECTSEETRKKIVMCGITLQMILDAHKNNKFQGLKKLLCSNDSSAMQVAKNDTIPKKIFDFLEKSIELVQM